jgi:GNAT superfamily N-acetyltransferase
MSDLLVKLYTLPDIAPDLARLEAQSIFIRQAEPGEKRTVTEWVSRHFRDPSWAVGCEWSIQRDPVSCYIAVEKETPFTPSADPYVLPREKLVGFACYDVSARGMFGPLGVQEDYRGRGIGRALLLVSLRAMAAERYAYAVIGWAGSDEFYQKAVGAILIEDSAPGIFRGMLYGED